MNSYRQERNSLTQIPFRALSEICKSQFHTTVTGHQFLACLWWTLGSPESFSEFLCEVRTISYSYTKMKCLFTLIFSWVCSGVCWRLNDVWYFNRVNAEADGGIQSPSTSQGWRDLQKYKTMLLSHCLFCFGKESHFSLNMLLMVSEWAYYFSFINE